MTLAGAGLAGLVNAPWQPTAYAADPQDADLVVFNAKVYTVDKGKIKDLQIVRTVVGGATVYQA